MGTIGDLETCAELHLDAYMNPASGFAFRTYDNLYGFNGQVTPLDCFAPNLLSLRLTQDDVIPSFRSDDTSSSRLRHAMQRVLDETDADGSMFSELDSIDAPEFRLGRYANSCTESVKQWTPVTVSKVLHRLRPWLVPVYDSLVCGFYGAQGKPAKFYSALHADMSAHRELLARLTEGRNTPDSRQLSDLRALDIAVWHHVRTGCENGSR